MACLAVGQLFSTLTQNQIVAALIAAAVLLALLVRRPPADVPGCRRRCAAWWSICRSRCTSRDFIQGLVRTEAVAFYLIVSAIALTLSASYLQWRR